MLLYHGTSEANTKLIESEGLLPRKDKGNWNLDWQRPSLKNFVYLTSSEVSADFFAARTAVVNNSSCSVLQISPIEKIEENFYPDENYFIRPNVLAYKDQMKDAQKKVKKNKDKWKASLEIKTLVAHKGVIPPEFVKTVRTYDLKESIYYGFVKNFDEINIRNWEYSFNIFNFLAIEKWFHNASENETHDEILREFEIIPETVDGDLYLTAKFRHLSKKYLFKDNKYIHCELTT